MKLDDRIAALLALVEDHRDKRSQELLAPASEEARRLAASARHAARARVGAAIATERAQYSSRVASAEARLATRRRMARQHRVTALIVEAWQRLPKALAARWADAGKREAWVRTCLAQAAATLPQGTLEIEAPAGWSEAEQASARAWLAGRGVTATVRPDKTIAAGLRLRSGGIVLDATLEGLLADRVAIEGRLLNHFEELAP